MLLLAAWVSVVTWASSASTFLHWAWYWYWTSWVWACSTIFWAWSVTFFICIWWCLVRHCSKILNFILCCSWMLSKYPLIVEFSNSMELPIVWVDAAPDGSGVDPGGPKLNYHKWEGLVVLMPDPWCLIPISSRIGSVEGAEGSSPDSWWSDPDLPTLLRASSIMCLVMDGSELKSLTNCSLCLTLSSDW